MNYAQVQITTQDDGDGASHEENTDSAGTATETYSWDAAENKCTRSTVLNFFDGDYMVQHTE